MKTFKQLIVFAGFILTLASCHTEEKILYLQDIEVGKSVAIKGARDIVVQPKDQISILVSSKDPELAALFNLTRAQYRAGYQQLSGSSSNGEVSGYTLDERGNIDFPQLGEINIAGKTKGEIATFIKNLLISKGLVKDPVVTVEFMNLYFSATGEVNHPGKFSITKDQITLLEAISMAGDLSIYGKRDGVFVIREENGKRTTYQVDLRSKDIFDSPVYYLKQNDVIYVQPNETKTKNSEIGQSTTLWISGVSIVVSVASLLVNILK